MEKTLQLWFGILFTAIAPPIVGWLMGGGIASLSAACGAFIILMAKPEILSELSLGPLKAKMQKTIAEAVATLDQLRGVAATMASVVLSDLMAGHFMWGMTFQKRLDLHDELIGNLRKIGVSKPEIDKAESEWQKGMSVIYHNQVGHKLYERAIAAGATSQAAHACVAEFNALVDKATRSAQSPADHENLFKKHGLLTPEVQSWLDDYAHYVETNEVRRRDMFAD